MEGSAANDEWEVGGAGGRTRTDMSVTSPDFESGAYTSFATPAKRGQAIIEASERRRQLCESAKNLRKSTLYSTCTNVFATVGQTV